MPEENYKTFVAHILRYTSDLVRDEWLNIGILLFDPGTGERSIRLMKRNANLPGCAACNPPRTKI